MTHQEKRIKIAERMGWKRRGRLKVWNSPIAGGGYYYFHQLPNYFTDLNAIDSAVLSVLNSASSRLNWDYASQLGIVTQSSHPETGVYVSTALIHASAEQLTNQ
jgi:hypothetical protein